MSGLPELSSIREAQRLLANHFPPTPLVKAPTLSRAGVDVYLKIETGLPTGSFKPRGAIYALIKNLGRRNQPGIYFLNDATDPDLPAGPGTIGAEILQQLPDLSAVFVPMGDTALIRGLGSAIKQLSPQTKVIGVQAERAPSYVLSWRAGTPVPTDTCDTIADGLATRSPDSANVADIHKVVDDVVLVSEEQMLDAIRHLHERENVLAEPAGAAATAAYLAHPIPGRVALLVSGGNISDEIRQRAGIAT